MKNFVLVICLLISVVVLCMGVNAPAAEQREACQSPDECCAEDSGDGASECNTESRAAPETSLSVVYRRIRELRSARHHAFLKEDHRACDRLAEQLSDLEQRFRTPVSPQPHLDPHVHAVGVYAQQDRNEPVVVNVTDASGPIVLILSGYDSVDWQVNLGDEVRIDLVFCIGYHRQHVEGLPGDVPVFSRYYGSPAGEYAYAYGPDRQQWKEVEAFLHREAGLGQIRTIQGGYHDTGSPFIVGAENIDWRVQMLHQSLLESGDLQL